MGELTFTIVYSNYTMQIFVWRGTPSQNKKYLGNRDVLGSINAASPADALAKWRSRSI